MTKNLFAIFRGHFWVFEIFENVFGMRMSDFGGGLFSNFCSDFASCLFENIFGMRMGDFGGGLFSNFYSDFASFCLFGIFLNFGFFGFFGVILEFLIFSKMLFLLLFNSNNSLSSDYFFIWGLLTWFFKFFKFLFFLLFVICLNFLFLLVFVWIFGYSIFCGFFLGFLDFFGVFRFFF